MATHGGSRVIGHSVQVVNSVVWGGSTRFQAPKAFLAPRSLSLMPLFLIFVNSLFSSFLPPPGLPSGF